MDKLKILIIGDVHGKFSAFSKKIDSLQKKNSFDLIFCVGEFFSGSESDMNFLKLLKSGEKKLGTPVFVLGAASKKNDQIYKNELNESNEFCENLTYLGKSGSYTTHQGLKVVYLSGIEKGSDQDNGDYNTFSKEDIDRLLGSIKTHGADYRGVDLLLTTQWPAGMAEDMKNTSSTLISWLSTKLKPRYHFCGWNRKHYEHPPFRYDQDERSSLELCSRFVALAELGNPEKLKHIYALNVIPVAQMRLTDLIQKSTDEVEVPYMKVDFSKFYEGRQQYFFNMDSSEHENRKQGHQRKKFKQSMDLEKCWFCLSSETVDKSLIISIANSFYIAAPKGPLNQYHVLILSINHIQSASLLNAEDFEELDLYKRAIRKYFESEGMLTVFFERNYKSSHLQINAVGIEKEKINLIKESFDEKAEEYGLKFEEIARLNDVKELPEGVPYFVAELPDNTTLITKQMARFPLNYGREVLCSEYLLNCEDKIDWKLCLLPKNLETKMVSDFKDSFKDFDFTVDDDDE